MFRIYCLIVGYFIGCIESAYFVGKLYKVDIRNHGSGNLGTTNALRVLGKKAGLITFICDMLKSVVAFFLAEFLFGKNDVITGIPYITGFYAAAGAILGHDFPFYLRFKGGKGMASLIGLLISYFISLNVKMVPVVAIIPIFGLFTGYMSVASISLSIMFPITLFIFGIRNEIFIVSILLCILALYRHRKNIVRLINHKENKIFSKKKKED